MSGNESWAFPGRPILAIVRGADDRTLLRHKPNVNRHIAHARMNPPNQGDVVGIGVYDLTFVDSNVLASMCRQETWKQSQECPVFTFHIDARSNQDIGSISRQKDFLDCVAW